MGISTLLVAGIFVMAVILSKLPAHDLRSVSDHWIAEHHVAAP